jgi:tRNA-specific 2-thiouridylase
MRVLVAMSGGVDSSVAAAVLVGQGHEVVGATLKLWGGPSDSGCCSVSDVEDARRVADRLGIDHYVFDDTAVFEESVVRPYVGGHARGQTPNPCVACNRHLKFGLLLERARRLGFEALATGHHARLVPGPRGFELRRGRDQAKDQSYVVAMLGQRELAALRFPVGELTKPEVRELAGRLGLPTAQKPDSQDVCFVSSTEGREGFLRRNLALHPGRLVDVETGELVGEVPAVELVTVGQRRGLSPGGRPSRRYAVAVDVAHREVLVGPLHRALVQEVALDGWCWVHEALPEGHRVLVQTSAHGSPRPGWLVRGGVRFERPERPVAPGQLVAWYDPEDPDRVLGSATAIAPRRGSVPRRLTPGRSASRGPVAAKGASAHDG